MTVTAFVDHLTRICRLPTDVAQALACLIEEIRTFGPNEDIYCQGEEPLCCCIVLDGWASSNRVLESGKRQITALHHPGSMLNPQSILIPMLYQNVTTLKQAHIGFIRHTSIREFMDREPRLLQGLWRENLIEAAIAREWIVNVGSRSAVQRIAHLFCETITRLQWSDKSVQDGNAMSFPWPLTQHHLSEAIGITSIHVNRSLHALRDDKIIGSTLGGKIEILDKERLVLLSGFDPKYLQPGRPTA